MFLDPHQYPFTEALEAGWEAVRDELLRLGRESFMVFPERRLYEKGWDVFSLYAFGRKMDKNCRLCPRTAELVEAIPGMTTAAFSRMEPGTEIKPHVGYQDTVLRCHLALVVPPDGCAIRVGPETRGWQEGKCLVFDDTTDHEAWNRSDSVRVVLIIDFTKPGAVFEAPAFIRQRLGELAVAAQRSTES
jgi:beta-hydroxylase